MQKFRIVTSYPLDEPVVRNRLMPFAKSALQRGMSVVVHCPGGSRLPIESERLEYHFVGRAINRDTSFSKRAISEAKQAMRLIKSIPKECGATVLISIPSMFLLPIGSTLGISRKVLDVRDLSWEYISQTKLTNRFFVSCFKYFSRLRIKYFDIIFCTNDREMEYISNELGVPHSKLIKVPNGISREIYNDLAGCDTIEKRSEIVVSYIGNIGHAQNLRILVDAAARLPDISFNIVGNGTEYEGIRRYLEQQQLPNVSLRGRVPWNEVLEIYRTSQILYAQLSKEFSGAVPSKLYEYLATGKFVVFGGQGIAATLLLDYEMNEVIIPDSVSSLEDCLRRISNDNDFKELSQHNRVKIGREFIREENVEAVFDRIV